MGKLAFIFPGQGSQRAGMGKALAEQFPAARAVFDRADQALGFPLSKLCFEGPEEELKLTANTQPAILTTSVAAYRVLEEKGIAPDYVAGHSLGEYSALVASGCLSLPEAVVTVRNRGTYMQEAVPAGQGAMAALLACRCRKCNRCASRRPRDRWWCRPILILPVRLSSRVIRKRWNALPRRPRMPAPSAPFCCP